MRSLLVTAAVTGAALALGGCHNKRPEPGPGPQSAHTRQVAQSPLPHADGAALAPPQCPPHRSLLRF